MRSLKPALFAAAGSKTAGLAIQLVALPVALKAIGAERYGDYVALLAATSWAGMFEGGLGIHLIKQIGLAQQTGDHASAVQTFRSGVRTLASVGLPAVVLSVALMLLFVSKRTSLSGEHLGLAAAVIVGSWLSLVLGFVLKVRVALDQVHYNNLAGLAGNVLALLMLGLCFLRGDSHSLILFYACCAGSMLAANIVAVSLLYWEFSHLWKA